MPYDPAIPLLGIHTKETRSERDTCTPMYITALFIIARTWKQPRCPSADKWIRKLWYIYTMEYYSAVKKNSLEHRVFIQHSYTLKFLLCVWKHFCSILSCGLRSPSPPLRELAFWWGEKMDSGTRAGGGESGWVGGWVGGLREEWGGWGIKSGFLRGIEVMRALRSWGPAREGQGRHFSGSGIARQSSWWAIPECLGRFQALPASQKAVTDTRWCPVVNIGIVKSFKCLMSVLLDRSLH